jgi:hypothetical protein
MGKLASPLERTAMPHPSPEAGALWLWDGGRGNIRVILATGHNPEVSFVLSFDSMCVF